MTIKKNLAKEWSLVDDFISGHSSMLRQDFDIYTAYFMMKRLKSETFNYRNYDDDLSKFTINSHLYENSIEPHNPKTHIHSFIHLWFITGKKIIFINLQQTNFNE